MRRRLSGVRVGLGSMVLLAALSSVVARAPMAAADDPLFVDWTSLLPSLSDAYDPNSANECVAGKPTCIDKTIKEMDRRFEPLASACDHDAIFSLAYLRTTQTYKWARDQVGFFADTPFVNHEDAVFAKYYFSAYDAYQAGDSANVPPAWQLTFDANRNKTVNANGSLLLGMNAHVNRDLAFVLASIGITYPDGTSRKADHDKVNQFLNVVVQPLLAEEAARFDPSFNNFVTPYGVGYTAFFQMLAAWREQAWRNAEALTNAPTAADRALVAQQIEASAAAEAQSIISSNGYVPLVATAGMQDAYCAAHNAAPAPMPYAFGTA